MELPGPVEECSCASTGLHSGDREAPEAHQVERARPASRPGSPQADSKIVSFVKLLPLLHVWLLSQTSTAGGIS